MSISLPSLISTLSEESEADETPEDILHSALTLLDPTAAHNLHGAPGGRIQYASPPAAPIALRLSDPPADSTRRLFAHYVWNAGVLLAEAVGRGPWFRSLGAGSACRGEDWGVGGMSVLELGAGTALSSLVAARSGASAVAISDFPAPHLISSIASNVEENLSADQRRRVAVRGHCWGELGDEFSSAGKHSFRRVIAADTLWIASQHLPLAESMAHFLSRERGSRVWVAAGFHTGRRKVAAFFEHVGTVGLRVLRRYEVDVDGNERAWVDHREGEDVTGGAGWTMVAVLGWDSDEDKVGRSDVT